MSSVSIKNHHSKITLLITIDTECDFDIHYKRYNPFTFTSVTFGIPRLLRPLWDKYHVSPIYFVSPEVVNDEKCCIVLQNELKKGAIIGAHLHSELIEPEAKNSAVADFPCYAHSTEIEYKKIQNLTELIEKNIGCRPEWYRAGRFGADLDTIKSLKKLGYKYDSSVTPKIDWTKYGGPDHRHAPHQPYWISTMDYYTESKKENSLDILEVPVTIAGKRLRILGKYLPDHWFFYTWLRPTHVTTYEQKRLIRRFVVQFQEVVLVMIFHSFEVMIKTSPYVRNRVMQKMFLARIKNILQFMATMENVSFRPGW